MFSEAKRLITEYENLPEHVQAIEPIMTHYRKEVHRSLPKGSCGVTFSKPDPEMKEKIVKYISKNPGAFKADIAQAVDRVDVSSHLYALLKCRTITRQKGPYHNAPHKYFVA